VGIEAAYLQLHRTGELANRVEQAKAMLTDCRICGWNCGINRSEELGPCRTGMKALVATAYVHHGEEKPLVANGGSGAVFFANCDLRCQFCQTYRWNIKGQGQEITAAQLASVMVGLQDKGAGNINFVTPTHVAPQILEALLIAVEKGLHIPLVWNSGGYDSMEILKLLDGIIDIYMPDMKYSDESLAHRTSGIRHYPQTNRRAVTEMHRQVGDLVQDETGAARRGMLIRHLVMPGTEHSSRGVLDWIAANLGSNTYLSLMDQYRPAYRAFARDDIGRPITPEEFDSMRDYALSLGLTRLDNNLLLPVSNSTREA